MRWPGKAALAGIAAIGLGALLGRFATGGMSALPDAVSYRRAAATVVEAAPASLAVAPDPRGSAPNEVPGAPLPPPPDARSPAENPGSPRAPDSTGHRGGSPMLTDILPRDGARDSDAAMRDPASDDWRGDPREVEARDYERREAERQRYEQRRRDDRNVDPRAGRDWRDAPRQRDEPPPEGGGEPF
jgi:hypothetical protein